MTEPRESATDPAALETKPPEFVSSAAETRAKERERRLQGWMPTTDPESVSSAAETTASANHSKKPRLLIGIAALLVIAAGFTWSGMQTFGNRARAQRMIERAQEENLPKLWKHARLELQEYLQFPHKSIALFSSDGDAQLLLVEALIHDESLTHEDAVKEALTQLRNIPSEAPQGAQARAKEGKLYLMMVHKLGLAERALREAIKLNPQDEESHFLLWKLLELTGRADWSEEIFWRVYELTHPDRRPVRLRQWYMTQFFAPTANLMLERQMGLLGTEEVPSSDNEYERFDYFRKVEPTWPVAHAALAKWFLDETDPNFAKRMLDEAAEKLGDKRFEDPFFVATLIRCLTDLGQYDEARDAFQRWPTAKKGYDYYKWQAVLLSELDDDDEQAADLFEQALAAWPGPVDWQTRHRKKTCLQKLQKHQEAQKELEKAKQIEKLMEREQHAEVRDALANLGTRDCYTTMVKFYTDLGMQREAQAWQDQFALVEKYGEPPVQEVRPAEPANSPVVPFAPATDQPATDQPTKSVAP